MNETKYTPGPWDVYDRRRLHSDNEGSTTIIAGDIWIACVHGSHVGPQSKEEVDANVSLVVAAPKLLEALKRIIDEDMEDSKRAAYFGGYVLPAELRDLALDAIAKAEKE